MSTKPEILDKALDEYRNIESERYLGIFGHPIKHTLSPIIHDTLSENLGIGERYIAFDIEENLGEMVTEAYAQGIIGLNITVPYKQEVMDYLVNVDMAAHEIGAVNTLVRDEGGYKGYNTDMPGLARALDSEGISIKGENIIMLGAGGAARAVAYMCQFKGANTVYIVNRTLEKAERITNDMNRCTREGTEYIPVAADKYKDIPKDNYIFIQCTSVGLKENDGLPIVDDEEFYSMASAGVDLIYNPARTPFLKLMEKLGKKSVNGLKMLLYQGVMAYELWNKVNVSDELSNVVYGKLCEQLYGTESEKENNTMIDEEKIPSNDTHTAASKNIVLIGYMGSGKTTVGKYICEKYGYDFVDTDEYIVNEQGMSINEIFEKYGEEHFRNLETETVKKLAEKLKKTVIATGGGLPVRAENEEWLKKLGRVYYLKADADTIHARVCNDTSRPLLKTDDLYGKIKDMLAAREGRYMACADCVIEIEGENSVMVIADKIMSLI